MRIFEVEEMGNDGDHQEGELSDAQKKLPVTKEDQRNMIIDLKKFITESQGNASQKFEESVQELKAEIVKQNETITSVRNDVIKMNGRIETLEKREKESEEMIDAKIKERGRKMERRRKLEKK